jgi:hypothetical protein
VKICTACGREHYAKGYCKRCYQRVRKHGDPTTVLKRIYPGVDAAGRMRVSVDVRERDQCWEWKESRTEDGYGRFMPAGRGRLVMAHRVAWEVIYGPIPPGFEVCHRCDNPPCCNLRLIPEAERLPDHPSGLWTNRDGRAGHLFLGTPKDNADDMVAKGRHGVPSQDGEANHHAKLTEDDVRTIRASTAKGVDLARAYGVAPSVISQIRSGKTWRHVQ